MPKSPSMSSRQANLRNSAMAHHALDYFAAKVEPESGLIPMDPAWIRLDLQAFSLPLDAIELNEAQLLRRQAPLASLRTLSRSIAENGLRQPLRVRFEAGKAVLTEGYRRYRACQEAGLTRVAAYIDNIDADQAFEWALVENMLRENLHPLEEADGIIELMRRQGYHQQRVAQVLGRSKAQISKYVRVSRLGPAVRRLVESAPLGLEQLYQIAQQKGEEAQLSLATRILADRLSTRESRALASPENTPARPDSHPILRYVEKLEKSVADSRQLSKLGVRERRKLLLRLNALAELLNAPPNR